jgi:hypothetical protein
MPILPRNSGFTASADRDTLGERPAYSHSNVSEIDNSLNGIAFTSTPTIFTVRFTVKNVGCHR